MKLWLVFFVSLWPKLNQAEAGKALLNLIIQKKKIIGSGRHLLIHVWNRFDSIWRIETIATWWDLFFQTGKC